MEDGLRLAYDTPIEWGHKAIEDFDMFLRDHADCERKASAMAMSFIAKCPDRIEIHQKLIDTAIEELHHFKMVHEIMVQRGITFKDKMPEDLYIKQLISCCRSSREERLMDRMLIAGIVEYRGAERFHIISKILNNKDLKQFYKNLYLSEYRHGDLFIDMSCTYWSKNYVRDRLNQLLADEAKICEGLEWRSALH